MFFRKSTFSMPLVATALVLLLGSFSSVTSFTVAPSRVVLTHATTPIPSTPPRSTMHPIVSSSTALGMNFSPPGDNDYGGLERGKYLLILVMMLNVWLFSIPPEFRRARLCTEEDVKLHPEKNCTTFAMWRKGVAEYYANGGGVKFDFSVEGKE